MNGYQRIADALAGRQPDRPPVMLHNFMMAAREAGHTMAEFRNDPGKIADSFIRSVETYGYDGVLVDVDTVTLAGAVGVPVDFPEDQPARSHEACLTSWEQLDQLQPIDVGRYKYVQIWLEAVSLLKQHFGDEVYVRGNCDQAPFSLASMMRTPLNWMMDLVTEEDRAVRLVDYCTDITCQFIKLMATTGADMVSNGDSPAGPEMISPDMYARFALPAEKRVVDAAHACGMAYALHICGNTNAILDLIPTTGADAVDLDYKTDARAAANRFEGAVTFIGNIDPSGVLARGSEDDVRRATATLLEVFAGHPRFILNSGCAIPASTPARNLKAMIQTARGC